MGQRINWSVDGSLGYRINVGSQTRWAMSGSDMTKLDGLPIYNNTSLDLNGIYGAGINFPSTLYIEKISVILTKASTLSASVSSDSTNGLDGNWTVVASGVSYSSPLFALDIPIDATCTWVRFAQSSSIGFVDEFHVFGEYDSPSFEFWNLSETQELSDGYSLLLENAQNHSDYSDYEPFKIKNTNTDGVPHSYAITVTPIKYGGDSLITNYFTLSEDNGATKVSTINIVELQPGAFSAELRVYADIPAVNNPADGYHYFTVKVVETT
jgi:hypothetical protein